MIAPPDDGRTRKPRADAQRNRDRILVAAREEFSRCGAEASLEEVARQAGVGPGTLYRHFPTREALLVAVYRAEMQQLAAAADTLTQQHPPVAALRAWLLLFIDAVETKQVIAPVLNALVGEAKTVFEASYGPIHAAVRRLVSRAVESGELRADLEPVDLLRAIVGVANLANGPDWRPSARRLVDILIAGSRAGA